MKQARLISLLLIALTITIITLKFSLWNYTFINILPKNKFEVSLDLAARGFNQPVDISAYLPVSDNRQDISNEINNSPGMNFLVEQSKSGRKGKWNNQYGKGLMTVNYRFEVMAKTLQYNIDSAIVVPDFYPPGIDEYLSATENIQVNHPEINRLYLDLIGSEEKHILKILKVIHQHTLSLKRRPFKGVTDALTTLRLGEGSCNGKSRLFTALAREAGIPTRLVGGLILETGRKKTSHQWLEVYIQNEWIPFDPLNDHFATLPYNYLTLYKGDHFLFAHTTDINFDYSYTIKSRLSPNPLLYQELKSHPFNSYLLWKLFEKIGIPLGLLKIILLLPLGGFIVAIFRNVIGLQTFGVFLPALIAVASRETGLMWGLFVFLIVIGIVSLVHFPLEKWGTLYTPKLVIMLISVVMVFILVAFLAIEMNITSLAYLALFPIVVLTISAERFARTITEEGIQEALWLTLQTMIVASVAYFVMHSVSMEAFFLAFPELFLALTGLSLLLGQWVGIRMLEFIRFKALLK